jgi:hypothetical protein
LHTLVVDEADVCSSLLVDGTLAPRIICNRARHCFNVGAFSPNQPCDARPTARMVDGLVEERRGMPEDDNNGLNEIALNLFEGRVKGGFIA